MRTLWLATGVLCVMVAACGQTTPTAIVVTPSASPNPGATASQSPTAAPAPTHSQAPLPTPVECPIPQPIQDLCVGRAATPDEQAALLAAGRPAVESKYGLKPIAGCKAGDRCFVVDNPLQAIIGTEAAVFSGRIGAYPQGGLGCSALVFLDHDSGGWHYVNSGCDQNVGYMPGTYDQVFVSSGCANVRTAPSISASVVTCLKGGTQVAVDSAPTSADGHIWWHLAGRGWMAHDYLISSSI